MVKVVNNKHKGEMERVNNIALLTQDDFDSLPNPAKTEATFGEAIVFLILGVACLYFLPLLLQAFQWQ